ALPPEPDRLRAARYDPAARLRTLRLPLRPRADEPGPLMLNFLVPAFLVGLISLAIPVLIHLSRRQTRDPVQFPSLMFLKKIPQETEERRQIHRWPLLLLRLLALLLLVLAFARPFID